MRKVYFVVVLVMFVMWFTLTSFSVYQDVKRSRVPIIKNYGFLYHDGSIMVCSSLDTISLRGVVGVVDMDKLEKVLEIKKEKK